MANMTIFPTGLTYSRNTKAPLMDKQVFDTLALAQAYVNNADETAYVGLTISVVADGANNGLYYVDRIADGDNATGLLVKVGSDSAADVASLQTDVADIKTILGDSTSGLVADVAANTAAISNKADNFTVGNGLSYSENSIGVVVSPAEGNSLSVTENGLYVSVPEVSVPEYTIVKAEITDGIAASYRLTKDGTPVGAAINIPLDQVLKSAEILVVSDADVPYADAKVGDKYIKFTFQNNENNPQYLPVQDLVDVYTADEVYINMTEGNVITLDIAAVTDRVDNNLNISSTVNTVLGHNTILVGADGKSGLVADVAKNTFDISTLSTTVSTNTENIEKVNKTVGGIISEITDIRKEGIVNRVDETDVYGIKLVSEDIDDTGAVVAKINVDIDKLATAVIAKHQVPTPTASDIVVSATGSFTENTDVQTAIANLDSRIKAAVSGGVTSVVAGNAIVVNSEDVNNPTVSVNTEALISENSALTVVDNKIDLVWSEL